MFTAKKQRAIKRKTQRATERKRAQKITKIAEKIEGKSSLGMKNLELYFLCIFDI